MADLDGLAQDCSLISKPPHVPSVQLVSSICILLHNGGGLVSWLRGVSWISKLCVEVCSDQTALLKTCAAHADRGTSRISKETVQGE